ncbi:hypothetical protein [Streptomyces mexicanus]|uniref:hypothetical protein n=1 Tax=Streptomyces mexicanus TaxID=178566 RepID=UPI0036546EC7
MARAHGRILSSIWEDEDFLALTQQQQRLYFFLISQPNLNHAGLLPLTLRRWARKAQGLTADELHQHLEALAAAGFIVIDEDTEELLIRSFVRNDGVWKQPKVMGAMVSGAMEISSKELRRALLSEMERIPLEELSDAPTKWRGTDGPSIREQVAGHIEELRKAFGDPGPGPSRGGSATPSEPPSGAPSAPPSDTPADGDTQGPRGTRADARACVRAHSPAPTPTPVPSHKREGAGQTEQPPAPPAGAQRPDGRPSLHELPDDFTITDAMRVWVQQTFPRVDIDHETQKFIWHHRGEGTRRRNWYEAWKKWIADANQHLIKYGPPTQGQGTFLVPLPGGGQRPTRRSTTDERVAQALAIAAELRAEEGNTA